MNETSRNRSARRFAWMRTGFDMEGLVGALAALLVGLLLGMLWSVLFWLGVLVAAIILVGTRHVTRAIPDAPDAMVAPVDGVVVSVEPAMPPTELRFGAMKALRVRVGSSPVSPNPVFSPIGGMVETLIVDKGEPSAVFATNPDGTSLTHAYLTLGSETGRVGLRLGVGGFGPRLDLNVEAADTVRLGRVLGQRRMGGWCDVYLPEGTVLAVRPGMTLVGGETELVARAVQGVAGKAPHEAPGAPAGDDTGPTDPAEAFAELRRKVEQAAGVGQAPDGRDDGA